MPAHTDDGSLQPILGDVHGREDGAVHDDPQRDLTQPGAASLTRPQGVVPPDVPEFVTPGERSFRVLAVAGATAAAVLGGFLIWAGSGDDDTNSEEDRATADQSMSVGDPGKDAAGAKPDCAMLERLTGRWKFTTEVLGAPELAQLGMHGYYELEIAADGCSAEATLVKKGYSGKRYKDKGVQRATVPLEFGDDAMGRGFGATFALRDERNRGSDQEFRFSVHEDRLVGTYRHRSDEETSSLLSGFLEGVRPDSDQRPDPTLKTQPCAARCATACAAPMRADAAVPADAVDTCRSACRADDEEPVACGDASELPQEFRVPIFGPDKKVETICQELGLTCEIDPRIDQARTRDLKEKRLHGGWRQAHFLWAREGEADDGGPAGVRLALLADKRWFLTGPLLPPSEQAELELARIYARRLGEGGGRRYIVGEVSQRVGEGTTGSFFACRLDDGAPHCVVVPMPSEVADGETVRVTPLPGHTLLVEAPAEVSGSVGPGVYSW